jgi:hypothetical protein
MVDSAADHGVLTTDGGKRVIIEDVLSHDDAWSLRQKKGRLSWEDRRIQEPIDWVREFFPIVIGEYAYCSVEKMPGGHPWHVDTGTRGHMPWCRYSASVGLSPLEDFTGGGFWFRDMGPLFHYRGMIAFTTEFEHKVDSHKGDRYVLLMFFEGEDG